MIYRTMKHLKKYFFPENLPDGKLLRKKVSKEDLTGESSEYVLINAGAGDWMKKITEVAGLEESALKAAFGDPDFSLKAMNIHKVWGFEFAGWTFFVSTSKRGTRVDSECKDPNTIKGFYKAFTESMANN